MTLARNVLLPCVLVAGLSSACTFYTDCPDIPPPASAGGSGATGGTGGTGGTAPGSVSVGGEPPEGEWVNETFNLTDLSSECGNVPYLSAKPGEDLMIVSVAKQGLLAKASDDEEWTPLGQGEDSAVITNRGSTIVYDPEDADVFWQAGIYNGGGVYRTDDGGQTFIDLGLTHNDFVSIDFTDPKRNTLLASGHESPRVLHYSDDGGRNWFDIGDEFPEEARVCSWPVVIDASTFLLGCGTYGGGEAGIFRSTDVGATWKPVSGHRVSPGPLLASDGTQYWSGEGKEGIVRSDDQGETFAGPFGKNELSEVTPIELPDGRIGAVSERRVVLSSDQGETWRVVTTELPFTPNGIAYSAAGKRFYAYHWTCQDAVPEDAVVSYAFDVEAP
jgi:photosystem II stability/assembly factor-like uncharacterized protein